MTLAALEFEGRILHAEHARSGHEPHSAVTQLIQGVWSKYPHLARKILRSRIHVSAPTLTALDRGMVKVAAKRITSGYQIADLRRTLDSDSSKTWEHLAPLPAPKLLGLDANSPIDPMELAVLLEKSAALETDAALYERDRQVAAVLVSLDREILAAAINTNSRDRTRHAEVNLVQGWWAQEQKPLPKGSEIHVTVQCCRMCSGMIWDAAEDPWSVRVHYLRPDPGPMARGTILQAGSPERRLVTSSKEHLALQLEVQASAPSSS